MLAVTSCEEEVLVFPTLDPANVRFINTTQDVNDLNVVIDERATVNAQRGEATAYAEAASGRQIGFVLKDGDEDLRRDTLFYTLGAQGKGDPIRARCESIYR